MTIFLEVAQEVIENIVKTTSAKSAEADTSTGNTILTYVSSKFFHTGFAGRDQELGKEKRTRIELLLPSILEIAPDSDDKATLDQLIALIKACKKDTEIATKTRKQGNGMTEGALDKLVLILQDIYSKLDSLKLLNIPHDTDPLNSFRYYVALYYGKKIVVNKEDIGVLDHLILTQKIQFAEQQRPSFRSL